MAEEARQDPKTIRGWSRGPRSLLLRRHDHHGFGFTLRHFIVYPPESYTVLAGDRRLGLRPGALDEPMDTIFVKQVKPGSAADRAGLCTGDRVVSVNGETISGHSYASVVHRIHNSGHCLHLLVVPQDHDILQLYFNETAHRPESNLCGGGMVRPAPRRVSDTCAEPTDLYAQGCRLSLDAGLISRGEEATSQSSVSSSDDSIIISRIRRSCEQKEEFLRRPAAPLWPAPGAHGQATGPKEFYGRPQKLQPPPHWPPAIPASPLEREGTPPRERGFVYGGPVTNAARLRPGFNNALSRIQESPPSGPHHHPPPQIQVVSARARQFESGAPAPDRTSLYRSELARLSHKRMVPDVSVRARQYESQAEYHNRETRSLDSTAGVVSKKVKVASKPEVKKVKSSSWSLSPVGGLSGNRLVPVGGRNIHCEPPHSLDDNLRPRSNSAESAWLEEDVSWPMTRNRAVRQDSYLAACHKPSLAQAAAVPGLVEEQTCHANDTSPLPFPSPPPPAPEIRVEPAPRPARPVTLDLRSCDDLGTAEDSNCSPLGSPAVPWRDKTPNDIGSEEDRSTRRVSYLKATWPDRMNVDSDPDADQDVSDSEPPIRPPRKWRPPLFPDDIQKIRRFFEDHSDKRKGFVMPA